MLYCSSLHRSLCMHYCLTPHGVTVGSLPRGSMGLSEEECRQEVTCIVCHDVKHRVRK